MTLADFPTAEFEARLAKAQAAMHAQGLDALLFTTEAEMRYFTGFRTLFWQSPTRPWFLVLPASGKPVAIIPEIGAALMRKTWLDDIRTWASPHADDDGVSLLVDSLNGFSKIGVMMGRESYLRMPLADYQKLADRLPGANFINASDLVQALRMVKSPAEIEKTRAICAIASNSFANAENLFHEGQPLNEAFRAFKIDLLEQGAEDVPYLVGGAGQGGYADVISPPSTDPLRAGDVLMLDTGATLAGYYCDFDRNYAFGHADDTAKSAYRTLYRATQAALEIARPGTRCCDLYAAMGKVIEQEGSDVGRYGHGLGIQLTESPSIISFDQTVLKDGMVMTLEPGMSIGSGKIMVHEENILICDGPPQMLSERAAPELPVFGGTG
ncbi:MAG: aminopeptidase P family protein [Alphaproteobacteria bacterium]|jgi:Xaa-Pro dipeptidase|nr:aminopeptidase P family protein [Alphaproteobacteria bacterium]MBT4965537.1 aminopeptidase P family protein [Alphaproteobacteria bacterium]MBT5160372.1 aminopeptidase P family protein [Alphaproteobacteria bacterium]MBT5917311.1 aminopeptidase P family protein [Alphaproteobacteria bacterium]MBT6387282.1 aminopeptidase P family protein [Alphaproteobacteria bacterium]